MEKGREPATGGILPRPRINGLFREAVRRPLAKVVAGTGYGKTRSLTHFLSRERLGVAWVSLTEMDNLPAHFWESFVAAVAQPSPPLGEALRAVGFPDSEVAIERLEAALDAALPAKRRAVVVLDDFHLIENHDIHWLVERMAQEEREDLSIILLCRTEPALAFESLEAGSVYTIGQRELCFTPEETRQYLESQGLELPGEVIEQFCAMTEGWVVAIYLLALSCMGGRFPSDPLADVKAEIFAMIEREIFDCYPPDFQQSLVKISVLTSFQPGLVQAVAGGRFDFIDLAGPDNQFIHLDPFAGEYAVNQLFIEFLAQKFAALPPEEQTACHRRAAAWYAEFHYLEEAVAHYERCGLYDEMLNVIERSPGAVGTRQRCQWAIGVYEKVPAGVAGRRPITQVAYGGLLFMAGRLDDCRAQIDRILAREGGGENGALGNAVLGEAYMLKGLWGYFSMDEEMVDSFRKAAQMIPGGSLLLDKRLPFTLGNPSMFIFFRTAPGEVERVGALLQEAAPHTLRVLNGGSAGLELLFAAEGAYNRADLEEAEELAGRCRHRAGQQEQHTIALDAGFVLAKVHLARGERERAEATLLEMHREVHALGDTLLTTMQILMETWVWLVTGEEERIHRRIAQGRFKGSAILGIGSWFEQFLYARLLLQAGRLSELEAFLPVLDEICTRRKNVVDNRIEYHILRALLLFAHGEKAEAAAALSAAWELAHDNGLVMPFVCYGRRMFDLAVAVKAAGSTPIRAEWLTRVALLATEYEKRLQGEKRGPTPRRWASPARSWRCWAASARGFPTAKLPPGWKLRRAPPSGSSTSF